MEPTAPSLPLPLSLAACGATLALVLFQVWRLRDVTAAFVLLSIWFRYSIAAFHQFTYPPAFGGLSVMAVSSAVVAAVGVAVAGPGAFFLRKLVPFYAIILVILVSAALNGTWIGAINAILKWVYLIGLAMAAYFAMCRCGSDRILRALSVIFVGPIVMQWISVPMGVKLTNQDGSICFIGGYQHEQLFSIILLTFLFVTCFLERITLSSTYLRLGIVAAGLALANYRTSVLAAALPAASLALAALMTRIVKHHRSVAFVVLAAVGVFVFMGIAQLAQDRFADLGSVVEKGASLVQPPQYFTYDERRLFSGRIYLWSEYIDAYTQGNIMEYLLGFGPDSWIGEFPLYAHNTFVSYLYELGIFGVGAFIWILASNLLAAVRTQGNQAPVLIACHIGFVVLNLATMPIWTLEGAILYALLLAQTWYRQSLRTTVLNVSAARAGPRIGVRRLLPAARGPLADGRQGA